MKLLQPVCILIAILLILDLQFTKAQNVPTNGLVGHWTFDGTVNGDIAKNHGTVDGPNSTYGFDKDRFQRSNSSIFLDNQSVIDDPNSYGSNYKHYLARVSMPDFNLAEHLTENVEYTISIWVKPDEEVTGSHTWHQNIVMMGRPDIKITNQSKYFVGIQYEHPSTGYNTYNLESAGDSGTEYYPSDPNKSGSKWKADWYHLAVTYRCHNDTLQAQTYIGGQLHDYANLYIPGISLNYTSGSLTVGADRWGNNPFAGYLDDLRIYNRALSAQEILELNQESPSQIIPYNSLYGFWQGNDIPNTLISRTGPVLISENKSPQDLSQANGAYDNYKLIVEGDVLTERVKIVHHGDWPDYVFDEYYPLRTIEELAQFIEENKHLPGVPSASEISKEGIDVADMETALLEKVEELTLHLIQLHEQNQLLQSENLELKARLEKLELSIQSLIQKD